MKLLVITLLLCFVGTFGAVAGPPMAENDFYETAAGDNLSVDAPGVLENDSDPENDPLTAVLVDDPVSGGLAILLDDGSFEYEPPDGYLGTDSFTYQAYDGSQFSNVATVFVDVTGTAQFATFLDETAFLDSLTAQGFEATVESFEDDDIWGSVRSGVPMGNHTAPAISSMGIEWTGNNDTSEVTTSNGAAHTGQWGFYELPHGSYATGVDCHIPGNCTDGFIAASSPKMFGVGVWISGFFGSSVEVILDGDRIVDFGNGSSIGSASKFFGVIDPNGFHSFEVHELEGTMEDSKFLWADDFTFGTSAGITLSVLRGPGPQEVTLQWLGGQAGFSVFRSDDPTTVLDPVNELGQTPGRNWADVPPPGEIFFFQVTGL